VQKVASKEHNQKVLVEITLYNIIVMVIFVSKITRLRKRNLKKKGETKQQSLLDKTLSLILLDKFDSV